MSRFKSRLEPINPWRGMVCQFCRSWVRFMATGMDDVQPKCSHCNMVQAKPYAAVRIGE